MEKDLLLINKYCDTLKLTYYEKLSLTAKRDLLDVCFCLLKKYPQSPQIRQILELNSVLFLEISVDIEIISFIFRRRKIYIPWNCPLINFYHLIKITSRNFL
jgi:hypothetical protein